MKQRQIHKHNNHEKLLLGITLLFGSGSLLAQSWYVRPSVGSSFPVVEMEYPQVNDNVNPENAHYNFTTGDTSIRALSGNLGQGFKAGITVGKMFSDVIGVELGLNYLSGKEQLMAKLSMVTPVGTSTAEANGKVWLMDLSPSIVLQAKGKKVTPYARVGLFIPLSGKLVVESEVDDPTGMIAGLPGAVYDMESTLEVQSEFKLGYQGAVGCMVHITDRININAEVHILSFTSPAKEAEYTAWSESTSMGGLTMSRGLNELTDAERYTTFVDELTQDSNVPGYSGFNPSEARDKLDSYMNLSSVSFNIGVTMLLGKK